MPLLGRLTSQRTMGLSFVLLLATALRVSGQVEFSGFFVTSADQLVTLTDTETRRASGWLKVGQTFQGFTLVAFDPKQETITLEREGKSLRLALRHARVKDGKATVAGTISFANELITGVRTTLFHGEESSFPLKNGMVFRIKPEPLADGTIRYHARFISTSKGGEEVLSAPTVIALPGRAFGIQMGEFGYAFAP